MLRSINGGGFHRYALMNHRLSDSLWGEIDSRWVGSHSDGSHSGVIDSLSGGLLGGETAAHSCSGGSAADVTAVLWDEIAAHSYSGGSCSDDSHSGGSA